jgi:hypothetical protein
MEATLSNSASNTTQYHQPTPECCDQNIAPRAHEPSFTCDSQGCELKTFSSKGDLNRHRRSHDTKIWYACAAKDCSRKGKKGFYRKDKCLDHIIAAHDNDTLFVCPDNHFSSGKKCGGVLLTRDIFALHEIRSFHILNAYRDCPLPKCPYRIYLGRKGKSLDAFQAHLISHHDAKGRENFAGCIRERGYDAATGEIICPVCPGDARFADHSSFYHHFFAAHFHGPATGISASDNISTFSSQYYNYEQERLLRNAFESCTFVPVEVRQCRRTILSLWPIFKFYPVWEDIECD